MKDDLLRRLRQKVVGTDNNGQSYPASRNMDGDEAADEIERLRAERDALRALLRGATAVLEPVSFNMYDHDIREAARVMVASIDAALNKGGGK